jgi:hypothetical protein
LGWFFIIVNYIWRAKEFAEAWVNSPSSGNFNMYWAIEKTLGLKLRPGKPGPRPENKN